MSLSPDISRIACCDRGYGRPSGRPRVSDPATYCSSTPRIQSPAVARWHTLLHGLATPIREISGLKLIQRVPLIKKPELLNDILQETEELIKIFVTSIKTAEKKKK